MLLENPENLLQSYEVAKNSSETSISRTTVITPKPKPSGRGSALSDRTSDALFPADPGSGSVRFSIGRGVGKRRGTVPVRKYGLRTRRTPATLGPETESHSRPIRGVRTDRTEGGENRSSIFFRRVPRDGAAVTVYPLTCSYFNTVSGCYTRVNTHGHTSRDGERRTSDFPGPSRATARTPVGFKGRRRWRSPAIDSVTTGPASASRVYAYRCVSRLFYARHPRARRRQTASHPCRRVTMSRGLTPRRRVRVLIPRSDYGPRTVRPSVLDTRYPRRSRLRPRHFRPRPSPSAARERSSFLLGPVPSTQPHRSRLLGPLLCVIVV